MLNKTTRAWSLRINWCLKKYQLFRLCEIVNKYNFRLYVAKLS